MNKNPIEAKDIAETYEMPSVKATVFLGSGNMKIMTGTINVSEVFCSKMTLELMREKTDCEIPVIANACGVTYDEAKAALNWRKLPKGTENPVFGNPWSLYRALIRLGLWKKNVTLSELLSFRAEPGKTVVLIHDPQNPTLRQHWVTWHGRAGDFHAIAWGDSQQLRCIHDYQLISYFRKGWPNCAFTVYKASVWRLIVAKVQSWFN